MTFQAYLDNIKVTTGKTPDDFRALAKKDGLLGPELTATRFVAWMTKEHRLGRGHAMAIWAVFKDKGWAPEPGGKSKAGPAKAKS